MCRYSIAIILCATLRKHCNALGYEVLLIYWTVDMLLVGLVSQQFFTYWASGTLSCSFCVLMMLTMSLGFKDPRRLKYAAQDRAVLPLTLFITGSLLLHNLFLLHPKVYCTFSFLLTKFT
jgi:membrane-associated HD superfamily phosphohydrolase